MSAAPSDTYEVLPYEGQVIPGLSPEHLAFTSWLHDGPHPRLQACRVLELGCGDGANLLALAFHAPAASFVGVDSATTAIETARRDADELGLANVTFEVADVRALEPHRLGAPFDHVLCHGVFSWVSDDSRDAILALCGAGLAPDGVAYVSYNALPGWHVRGLVRELLLRATDPASPPLVRAAAARAHAEQLASLARDEHPYGALLRRELGIVLRARDAYLVHEYLAPENRAFWLGDFVALARRHGLAHLAEASFDAPELQIPDALREALAPRALPSVTFAETVDAVLYRQFRASVLCRRDAPRGAVEPLELLAHAEVALSLAPVRGPEFALGAGVVETFRGLHGFELDASDPTLKVALLLLASRWPTGLAFATLKEATCAALAERGLPLPRELDLDDLGRCLVDLARVGQAEVRLAPLRPRATPGPRMRAHALARLEAPRRGTVTTSTHRTLPLDAIGRELVAGLDGSCTVAELLDAIAAAHPEHARDELERTTRDTLAMLAAWGVVEPAP